MTPKQNEELDDILDELETMNTILKEVEDYTFHKGTTIIYREVLKLQRLTDRIRKNIQIIKKEEQ